MPPLGRSESANDRRMPGTTTIFRPPFASAPRAMRIPISRVICWTDARRLTSAPPSASAAAARRRSVRAAVATSVGTFRRTAPAAGVVGPAVRYALCCKNSV
jgi:hypothetical protein